MNVSYKWLKELVPGLTATAQELEDKMSITGIEVEGVTSPAAGLSKLVVGEILSYEDIPDTHLHVCQVNVGAASEGGSLQIVCGAPNVRVGMKAITALVGARIGGGVKISKGKIRGVESFGMLCALDELGIDDKINPMKHEEGIFEMPEDSQPGDSIFPILGMDDQIIELSITPNRADALSMRGVAYEVGAIYDLPVDLTEKHLQQGLVESSKKAGDLLSVKVVTDKIPTFKLRVVEGVKVAKSPLWLQNRLMNMGVRPINNVVDVTNYILMDYGQPLHSYDFDKLGASEFLVRQARAGETMTTLNGVEHKLSVDDVVVTANGKPVALGGVMGGLESEITADTTTVALEAAIFDATLARKTSQKFALRTEASSRFEKGINQGSVAEALNTAAAMIAELSGGQVLSGIVESSDYQPVLPKVSITLNRINRALGIELSLSQVEKIFHQLGLAVEVEGEKLTCEIPSRRWDIQIEADLVEEVARIYGYDKLPTTLPAGNEAGQLTQMQKFRRRLRAQLEAVGLSEVISYSLTTPEKAVQFTAGNFRTINLMLPLTEERQTLRVTMIPGLLDIIAYNQNRKKLDVAIYELGNVFYTEDNQNQPNERPTQEPNLAFAVSGNVRNRSYAAKAVSVDFYYMKGLTEHLLAGYEQVTYEPMTANPAFHPGRTALIKIGGRPVGCVGQIHPALAKQYGIAETYVANFALDALLEEQPAQTVYTEIPKVQAVKRDIALLVKSTTTHAQIQSVIESAHVKVLSKVELFDIFEGEKLGAGLKSMAYSLTFQATEQSLTDDEIAAYMHKISASLVEKLGAEIR